MGTRIACHDAMRQSMNPHTTPGGSLPRVQDMPPQVTEACCVRILNADVDAPWRVDRLLHGCAAP
jgi:hypothetical protein